MINSKLTEKIKSLLARTRQVVKNIAARGKSDAVTDNNAQAASSKILPDSGAALSVQTNRTKPSWLNSVASSDSALISQSRKVFAWFKALSMREKAIVCGGILVIGVVGIDEMYTPISDAFSEQAQQLAELERHATAAPAVVERYLRLRSRREQLEARFKEIEFKEGALSYIENLVRQQPGVAPGFDIREGTPKSFGKSFQQQPFIVRFQTTNAAGFVDFLKSVARGERSLLISKLDIQKPRRGDRLEVDLELNTIREAS